MRNIETVTNVGVRDENNSISSYEFNSRHYDFSSRYDVEFEAPDNTQYI